jgi:hypothetical protein
MDDPQDHSPQLFLFRNRNKFITSNYMNSIESNRSEPDKDLANQYQHSMEHLKAMQVIAKMKEAADRSGAGFVGGFVTASGQHFIMSNVDQDDLQYQVIKEQLEMTAQSKKQPTKNQIKIIESEDGIQLIIDPTQND